MSERLFHYIEKISEKKWRLDIHSSEVHFNECFNRDYCNYTFTISGKNAANIANKISDSFHGYFIKEDQDGYHIGCTLPNGRNDFLITNTPDAQTQSNYILRRGVS